MRLTGLMFALAAAASMVAAPALAQQANPAARLSLLNSGGSTNTDVRAGAHTKRSSKFLGTVPLIFIGLAVTGTIVGVAVSTSHSDNKPASA